tara:strand:- start:321 stop:482 length:162 start_codon:yes stop_codon:yes gene_type:complete
MKKFKFIAEYPIISIGAIAGCILIGTPIIFSLLIAIFIVVPIYLTVQLFRGKY